MPIRTLPLLLVALAIAAPVAAQTRPIRVCVVQSGSLREVSAQYSTATGDTLIGKQPFSAVHPGSGPEYAADRPWYLESLPLRVDGRSYDKYGLPRVLGTTEVERVSTYGGVPVFAEAGGTVPHEVIYLPVRPGCEFQPYQVEEVSAPAPAEAAAPAIRAGETVRGTLSGADPVLEDESHYDLYRYTVRAGERARIELRSDDFDAFLMVGRMVGGELEELDSNDDGDDDTTDSSIEITFPGAGEYLIRTNSYGGGETGSYTLRVTPLANPRAGAGSPRPAARVLRPGAFINSELTASDPTESDDSHYDDYYYTADGPETITVTLSSEDFDAYLIVGQEEGGEFEMLATDDDGAGGTDSRLQLRLPAAGEYVIRANSVSPGETGGYRISLQVR